jgi:hypothetical protein
MPCGQLASNLRITGRLVHNAVEVHSAPVRSDSLSTIHSQPDVPATLGRHWFVPSVHNPYYCCLYIS